MEVWYHMTLYDIDLSIYLEYLGDIEVKLL